MSVIEKLLPICLLFPFVINLQAQVTISTTPVTADPTAILDIQSTSQGVLVPRLNSAQRTSIATPATGLLVFDTDTKTFWYHNGISWTNLVATSSVGHVILDNTVNMPQREKLNFVSTPTIEALLTDDGANNQTTVELDIPPDAVGPGELASTAVTPGSYAAANITVDADGRITAATDGTADPSFANEGSLTVMAGASTTSVITSNTSGSQDVTLTAGIGLAISEAGNVITLANTGDTNAADDITAASAAGGDLSGPFSNLQVAANVVGPTELAPTAVAPGAYTLASITVDADGRITAASNGTADGSATNEGSLSVTAGSSTTSVISSNTSGSTDVTLRRAAACRSAKPVT